MWFEHVNMTPQRQYVADMMDRLDEGMGPRGYRTLLQVGDNDPRLRPSDAAWMCDFDVCPEEPILVDWYGISAGYGLTAIGKALYTAANRGDYVTIIKHTTDTNFGGALN